jgi:hypothetical protein
MLVVRRQDARLKRLHVQDEEAVAVRVPAHKILQESDVKNIFMGPVRVELPGCATAARLRGGYGRSAAGSATRPTPRWRGPHVSPYAPHSWGCSISPTAYPGIAS